MNDCEKCLGIGEFFNGTKLVPCDHCNGTGKSNVPYDISEDDDFNITFRDD